MKLRDSDAVQTDAVFLLETPDLRARQNRELALVLRRARAIYRGFPYELGMTILVDSPDSVVSGQTSTNIQGFWWSYGRRQVQ